MNWSKKIYRIINCLPLIIAVALISHKRLTRFFPSFSGQHSSNNQVSNISQENNPCPQHLPFGQPTGTPSNNRIICRDTYALSNNGETKFADWVAYRIEPSQLNCPTPKERKWQPDPEIPEEETLEPEDYKGTGKAGYDRGHQAPLASFKCKDWATTNYLSNITPQKPQLNRGVWKELEEDVRSLARRGEVFVITGPVYRENLPPLPGADEPHKIPSGYWKIVTANGETAYFFEQEADYTKVEDGIVDLSFIESITGLSFGAHQK